MTAPKDNSPAPIDLRTAAREVDMLGFGLSRIGHMIEAVEDRIDEYHGTNPETNERASAMLAATLLLLTTTTSQVEALTSRMFRDAKPE